METLSDNSTDLLKKTLPLFVTGGKKVTSFCFYCYRDITQQCKIRCLDCEKVELCSDCFCSGVNLLSHVNTHSFQISNALEFPIFSNDWAANEEILLIEGAEKCGVGNWKTISDYIGSKTAKQVEDHYWDLYMGIHGYCLPSQVIHENEHISMSDYINKTSDLEEKKVLQKYYECNVIEGFERGEYCVREKVKEISKTKDSVKEKNALLPGADLPGFLPLREDFDFEFDNDAELLLSDMEFNDDDHPSERALKHQVLQIFNRRIEERNKRKRFAIDRGLVDLKKQQNAERRRSKEERDLVGRLKIFSRFHSQEEHDNLVEGLLRARKLRAQIEVYQEYRKNGITTLEQGRQYEFDKKKKENDAKSKKQKSDDFLNINNVETSNSLVSSNSLNSSSSSLTNSNSTSRRLFRKSSSEDLQSIKIEENGEVEEEIQESKIITPKTPGANLLTQKEIEFCSLLPILPLHYLAVKDSIIREAFRNKILTQEGVRRVVQLDSDKQDKIFDFFVRNVNCNYGQRNNFSNLEKESKSDVPGETNATVEKQDAAPTGKPGKKTKSKR